MLTSTINESSLYQAFGLWMQHFNCLSSLYQAFGMWMQHFNYLSFKMQQIYERMMYLCDPLRHFSQRQYRQVRVVTQCKLENTDAALWHT